LDFGLFILVTATLFVRPSEIVSDLAQWPLYEILILSCLATSYSKVLDQLRAARLAEQPITVCVLGLLAAVVMSYLSRLHLTPAWDHGLNFAKVVIYYLLLVSVVDTPQRLRSFLLWLLACIAVVAGLAVLQYHGVIDIPSLSVLREGATDTETGEFLGELRLRSTGIFRDPNDLALILVVGMVIAAYWITDRVASTARIAALGGLGLFGYAFALTKSRGGLLTLIAALLALFHSRYGWRKTIVLSALTLPLVFVLFAGRQTDISASASEGTGQERIRYWSEGLMLFRQAPLFGIGVGNFVEETRRVTHNSYVQCYAEMGFFGGTIFFAAFAYALWNMHQLGRPDVVILDPEMSRLRPYLMAVVAGYAAGMASLSRSDVVPTYMLLGLANSYFRLSSAQGESACQKLDWPLVLRYTMGSCLFFLLIYAFVRTFARWG
jgi:O-antigen ligase